jgi:hypothetical protein
MISTAPRAALLLFVVTLSACGGGGSDGSGSGTPPPAVNRSPLASATASISSAYSSQLVTLSGAGSSDPDGMIASYAWTQISGPTLTLASANSATTTLTAPPVATRATYSFRLTVTDDKGAPATADVSVAVDPAAVDFAVTLSHPKPFIVDDETAIVLRGSAVFQGVTVTPAAVTWASDIQGALIGSSTGFAQALQAGVHTITARADFGALGTVTKTAAVRVLPRKSPVPSIQATAAANSTATVPVVIVNYIPTRDGINVDTSVTGPTGTVEWTDGRITSLQSWMSTITTRAKYMLEEGSRFRGYKNAAAAPYLGYRFVDIYNFYDEFPRGFPDPAVSGNVFPDYQSILARIPAQNYVETQGVREFWLFGYHFGTVSLNESNMASPTTGDVSNSYRTVGDLPVFSKTYIVYQNNFTRSHAEAVHNHGHQIEAMMAHINQIRDGNTNLFWRQFVGLNAGNAFAPGRCGATHFPLNATADYDYNNSVTLVQSDCEDWRPDGSGVKKASTLSTWADIPYTWPATGTISQKAEAQWYIYWMQNMPGAGNTIPYNATTMENWWQFVADWDQAVQSGKKLYK